MEQCLYLHLQSQHSRAEMTRVEKRRSNRDKAEMSALAYYVAAVSEKERDAMPLIGPSVDRRSLTLACHLAK